MKSFFVSYSQKVIYHYRPTTAVELDSTQSFGYLSIVYLILLWFILSSIHDGAFFAKIVNYF